METPPRPTTPKRKQAKPSAVHAPRIARPAKCAICGAEVAPISSEPLCWVCRRLKVSAWSENTDSQMFAPE